MGIFTAPEMRLGEFVTSGARGRCRGKLPRAQALALAGASPELCNHHVLLPCYLAPHPLANEEETREMHEPWRFSSVREGISPCFSAMHEQETSPQEGE